MRIGAGAAKAAASALALMLCCAACTSAPAPPRERLRVGIESAAASLDPRFATDAISSRIASLVHCSLVAPDPEGRLVGDLALSWMPRDERTWVFRLREDARFHDGSAVTAEDVVATFRSVLEPSSASPKKAALPSLASAESEGPSAVVFHLTVPDPGFLEGTTLGILPAALAAGPRAASAAVSGCGPYRVAGSSDERTLLGAAASWHRGRVTLPEIEFVVVPDTVMRTLQLRSGDLDLVENALEPDAARHLVATSAGLTATVTPYDAFQYLGINHHHPALADARVRRAIAHAIDREDIALHLLDGQADIATGLLPPHHAFHEGNVRRYAYDKSAAMRLLDRAGYRDPDGEGPLPRLRLRYSTSTVELRRRIAEVIAANLAEVGIEVTIVSREWATFFDDIARGNFDLYSLAWIGIRDPDLFRTTTHSAMTAPAGVNRGFFSNRRMDALTTAGRAEAVESKRRATYSRVQKLAARTLPVIPLWWPKNVVVMSKRIEGFTPDPSGGLDALARVHLR